MMMPIFFICSAYNIQSFTDFCAKKGINEFLEKPIKKSQLRDAMRKYNIIPPSPIRTRLMKKKQSLKNQRQNNSSQHSENYFQDSNKKVSKIEVEERKEKAKSPGSRQDESSSREESPKKGQNSYILNKMQVSVDEIGIELEGQNISRSLVNDLQLFA